MTTLHGPWLYILVGVLTGLVLANIFQTDLPKLVIVGIIAVLIVSILLRTASVDRASAVGSKQGSGQYTSRGVVAPEGKSEGVGALSQEGRRKLINTYLSSGKKP